MNFIFWKFFSLALMFKVCDHDACDVFISEHEPIALSGVIYIATLHASLPKQPHVCSCEINRDYLQ